MFRRAKVGDRVWSLPYGWGTIDNIGDNDTNDRFIGVVHDNDSYGTYATDGTWLVGSVNPVLFWDKIEFKIPPVPTPEKDALVRVWNNEYFDCKRYFRSFNKHGLITTWAEGRTSLTAEDSTDYETWYNWELVINEETK